MSSEPKVTGPTLPATLDYVDRLCALFANRESGVPGDYLAKVLRDYALAALALPIDREAGAVVAWMSPFRAEIVPASTIKWYQDNYGPDCQTTRDYPIPLYTHPGPPAAVREIPDERMRDAIEILCEVTGDTGAITDDLRMDHLCSVVRRIAALAVPK